MSIGVIHAREGGRLIDSVALDGASRIDIGGRNSIHHTVTTLLDGNIFVLFTNGVDIIESGNDSLDVIGVST